MRFKNKKILIVGFGKSGRSAAEWLRLKGAEITISDRKSLSDLPRDQVLQMRELGIEFETGEHRPETFIQADLIVISPGVPLDIESLRAAREKGIPVMGEMQLALEHIDCPVIAVTGTNGKSTVTSLVGDMIAKSGAQVFVGGNIGTPLTDYLLERRPADYVVIEVSSFQLDIMDAFSPDIAIVLNITPDHLDRYETFDDYARAKLKIIAGQKEDQFAILNDDDESLSGIEPGGKGQVLRYGLEPGKNRQACIEGERLIAHLPGQEPCSFDLHRFSLPGSHNRGNLMAGVLAGLVLKLDRDGLQQTINEFKGLPHRLEWVRRIDGVDFYNDSKATNIDAALRAIRSFDRPVVLIAGGRHKGAGYYPLAQGARGLVKKAVLLGEAGKLLAESFSGVIPCALAGDMQEAVALAAAAAGPGDAVLLAPACSSFDMFRDYVHRGEVFKCIVERLADGR